MTSKRGQAGKTDTDHKPRTFVLVSHTHWDREWYLPFQEFRARLVRMMDKLLGLLDRDPEYRHFVLDGQTVPLDDYLEVRPDRRADVERLVRKGRLLIGPNYVLPDEFLIGGESLIRNLQFGIRSARAYGGVMMVGYSPDAFGHVAHLPAVLRGFGLDSVAIWRGVGPEATTSEFRWAAPDGSEVLALHFPYGYGLMPVLPSGREELANVLQNIRTMLEPLATTRFVLVPNGTDHLPAHQGLSHIIRLANEILEDAEMVHGSYPMFVENLRRQLEGRQDDLPQLQGELRSSQRSHLLAGVLSTRMWLKQRYQQCEDLLARYAEPFSAWAHLLRRPNRYDGEARSDHGLLRQAWKLLLQNAPHDSVTGCSVDAVYEDVRARFNGCQQIAQGVLYDAQRYIADLAAPAGEASVAVFNPENGPRSDFCTVGLPLEQGKLPQRLVAGDGIEVSLQVLERGLYSPLDSRERLLAGFVAPDVPGFGYRVLRVEYGAAAEPRTENQEPTGPDVDGGGSTPVIVNEYFRVSTDQNDGTLTIEDERTGEVLAGLNRFVDGGERGDEYTHCPPARDQLIDRPLAAPAVRVSEDGPARRTLQINMAYSLPARLSPEREGRSEELVACQIESRVSLYPGVPRIDVETQVENRAEDHRLRVHFPSGVRAERTSAEQHFGVVQRPVALPQSDGTWFEAPVGTYPQKTFVDVNDGRRGLMIANRGLPEYEALEEDDGTVTLALTLLRCVGWLSRGDLRTRRAHAGPAMPTPGAQMPGRWTFQYSIIPHEGGWQNAYQEAHRFARPLRAVRTARGSGALAPQGALLEVKPPQVILSSLKLAEDVDAVVVRVYNTAPRPIGARIRLPNQNGQAARVDLNEEQPQALELREGQAELHLGPNEIATLKFQ